jgi:hypothetical protein
MARIRMCLEEIMVVCITTYFSTKDTPTLTCHKNIYEALGGAWRDFCMLLHEGYYWGMCYPPPNLSTSSRPHGINLLHQPAGGDG